MSIIPESVKMTWQFRHKLIDEFEGLRLSAHDVRLHSLGEGCAVEFRIVGYVHGVRIDNFVIGRLYELDQFDLAKGDFSITRVCIVGDKLLYIASLRKGTLIPMSATMEEVPTLRNGIITEAAMSVL